MLHSSKIRTAVRRLILHLPPKLRARRSPPRCRHGPHGVVADSSRLQNGRKEQKAGGVEIPELTDEFLAAVPQADSGHQTTILTLRLYGRLWQFRLEPGHTIEDLKDALQCSDHPVQKGRPC